MNIKQPTVLPPGTKIVRIAPSDKKVRSLYSLEKEHERKLEKKAELEEKGKHMAALLKEGWTVLEAMKILGV